ncbi:MAG TPA: glycosyltransferase [Anaerolineales bacterium]|nr:glycosyltransferase [Anaerolineales bacterium]
MEAIVEALKMDLGDRVAIEEVDLFKEYSPPPLNRAAEMYPRMVRLPQAWGLMYHLSDGRRRSRLITASTWPYVRRSIRKLVRQHPSDLIVSVHPFANEPVLRALGPNRPPFITVVTDLVTTHAFWYHRRTDLCIVPTRAAGKRALEMGLHPDQLEVIGLPVAQRFCQPSGDRQALRARLGWPQDLPMTLMVGGGEGMGPLEKMVEAINKAQLPTGLAIVAGRNLALKERLESREWPLPTFVYGFVREMPDFMQAADILVTKAGPGTISEAFLAELPIILYSRLPGQEDGNVQYVVSKGAGMWAPRPAAIVEALRCLLNEDDRRTTMALASASLARPDAARQIAKRLAERAGVS